MTDDGGRAVRSGSPGGLDRSTTASSSVLAMSLADVLDMAPDLLESGSDLPIPSSDGVIGCALALAGERRVSGASSSSMTAVSGLSQSDNRSSSGGHVVRAEKSSGMEVGVKWDGLGLLGVGIGKHGREEEATMDNGG